MDANVNLEFVAGEGGDGGFAREESVLCESSGFVGYGRGKSIGEVEVRGGGGGCVGFGMGEHAERGTLFLGGHGWVVVESEVAAAGVGLEHAASKGVHGVVVVVSVLLRLI